MVRRCLAIGLALVLASGNAFAQTLRGSLEKAAQQAVQQQAQAQKSSGPMAPKFLWTGIGLLAAGGVFLGVGAAEDDDTETCVTTPEETECVSHRTAFLTTGGLMAGAGAALLIIGTVKRSSPQITFRPGGVAVKQSVPLDLGIGRLLRR